MNKKADNLDLAELGKALESQEKDLLNEDALIQVAETFLSEAVKKIGQFYPIEKHEEIISEAVSRSLSGEEPPEIEIPSISFEQSSAGLDEIFNDIKETEEALPGFDSFLYEISTCSESEINSVISNYFVENAFEDQIESFKKETGLEFNKENIEKAIIDSQKIKIDISYDDKLMSEGSDKSEITKSAITSKGSFSDTARCLGLPVRLYLLLLTANCLLNETLDDLQSNALSENALKKLRKNERFLRVISSEIYPFDPTDYKKPKKEILDIPITWVATFVLQLPRFNLQFANIIRWVIWSSLSTSLLQNNAIDIFSDLIGAWDSAYFYQILAEIVLEASIGFLASGGIVALLRGLTWVSKIRRVYKLLDKSCVALKKIDNKIKTKPWLNPEKLRKMGDYKKCLKESAKKMGITYANAEKYMDKFVEAKVKKGSENIVIKRSLLDLEKFLKDYKLSESNSVRKIILDFK